jgi:hypothetical protein
MSEAGAADKRKILMPNFNREMHEPHERWGETTDEPNSLTAAERLSALISENERFNSLWFLCSLWPMNPCPSTASVVELSLNCFASRAPAGLPVGRFRWLKTQ